MSEEINKETGEEIDEEKEFIKTILQRTSEESFITSNYLLIEESALNFSFDDITEEDFLEDLTEMKETISKVQEGYENAYMNLDRWTLEIAIGDRMFREGLKEWEEGLDYLFEYCKNRDEEYINMGIKKIYEGNKKLIINQKIEEYVDEQVKSLQKEGQVPSAPGEVEKPVITGTVVPVTGHMPLLTKKEEKTEEKSHQILSASVPSIKISDKSSPSDTVIPTQKSEKLPEQKISSDTVTPAQKAISEKIRDVKISPEILTSEQKAISEKTRDVKISPEILTSEQKAISEKTRDDETMAETVSPELQEKEEDIYTEELHINEKETARGIVNKPAKPEISEKEEHADRVETEAIVETTDETSGKKAMRKPAGLSKRVKKSTHGESKISDIASDDNTEKKSIRRPAGLSRKAGKKHEG